MIFTGVVMILLFFGLSLYLVMARQTIPTVDEVQSEQRLKILADLNAENEKILTPYRWIDKSKGVVGIPIDRAMDLVLIDLRSNKPHPAGPVVTPAPANNAASKASRRIGQEIKPLTEPNPGPRLPPAIRKPARSSSSNVLLATRLIQIRTNRDRLLRASSGVMQGPLKILIILMRTRTPELFGTRTSSVNI